MKKLFDREKMEELLVANWSQFVSYRELLALTLEAAKIKKEEIKGSRISLSRFSPENQGFVVWVEFSFQLQPSVVEGTLEFLIAHDGRITQTDIVGNIF